MKSINTHLQEIREQIHKNGFTYIRVKANPSASKANTTLMSDQTTIKINLKSNPTQGKANKELYKKLEHLIGSSYSFKITQGEFSQIKIIKITIKN